MSRKLRRWSIPLGVTAALLAGAAPAAAADVADPIGPNQFYVGQVNGLSEAARIAVVCDRPADPGSIAHPVAGQTVTVLPVSGPIDREAGFTGSAGKVIGVGLAGSDTVAPPVVLRLYTEVAKIPTSLVTPCGGTGTMMFAASPASSTARTASVKVTFVRAQS
jgi:hypothetical protein